jgi:capsular exopolysaccharide synthesis family protein
VSRDLPPAEERISALRLYVEVARRRKLLVALCIAGPLALAIAYGTTRPERYQGTAQVVLSRQSLANALTGTPDPGTYASDFLRIVQTQADLARSPEVAARVVATARAGLTVEGFLADSSVVPARDADVLEFTVEHPESATAARLAARYAQQYIEFRRANETRSLEAARTQLAARIRALREQGQDSRLVSQLAGKEQDLRTLEALQTSNATVAADPTAAKISPRPKKYAAVGLLAGLLLAVGLAWAREALDTRVRSAKDVEDLLELPLLGHIGPPPSRLKGRPLLLAEPQAPEAEGYRIARMGLELMTLDRGIKSLLISSSIEREGKSTTAVNLALTMAGSGARVVLVDLDLRRPTVAKLLTLPHGPGIADVARGRVDLDDALVSVPLPAQHLRRRYPADDAGSLEVLRAGSAPPDPGEFVASAVIAQTLSRLRERADVLLIDTPPILQTSDALSISPAVDGIVLVARIPVLRRPMLEGLRRALRRSPVPVLGFIATGEAERVAGYGYGYGYGEGDFASHAEPEPREEPLRSETGSLGG